MGYFPLCLELTGKRVLLIGNGAQIQDKQKKLAPFGCHMEHRDMLTGEDLAGVAFVVVGDLPRETAAEAARLCMERNVPVNVVDRPELCSFFFPALITMGDLTVSASTGGKNPGAAAFLSGEIRKQLPDRTEEILDWLGKIREMLRRDFPEEYRSYLRMLTEMAFRENRLLTEAEWLALIREA